MHSHTHTHTHTHAERNGEWERFSSKSCSDCWLRLQPFGSLICKWSLNPHLSELIQLPSCQSHYNGSSNLWQKQTLTGSIAKPKSVILVCLFLWVAPQHGLRKAHGSRVSGSWMQVTVYQLLAVCLLAKHSDSLSLSYCIYNITFSKVGISISN